MFLFTTPVEARPRQEATPVASALRAAADETGVSFDFLLATAKRESALKPDAQASTSSARGLFQFVDKTWLRMLKSDGAAVGLTGGDGAAKAGSSERQRLLALRDDPAVSARMAAALAKQNRDGLSTALGREPTQGELYIAHFLGLSGATKLIRAAEATPSASAAVLFPDAARANRSIFHGASGARSVRAVYASLVKGFSGDSGVDVAAPAAPQQVAMLDAQPFHSLFHTSNMAPVSQAVANAWLPLAQRPGAVGAPLDLSKFSRVRG